MKRVNICLSNPPFNPDITSVVSTLCKLHNACWICSVSVPFRERMSLFKTLCMSLWGKVGQYECLSQPSSSTFPAVNSLLMDLLLLLNCKKLFSNEHPVWSVKRNSWTFSIKPSDGILCHCCKLWTVLPYYKVFFPRPLRVFAQMSPSQGGLSWPLCLNLQVRPSVSLTFFSAIFL